MAENQTKCTGNCMACTIYQRQYCASQLSYNNMRMLEQMQQTISVMQQTIRNINDEIETMQNNEALLFDPTVTQKPQPAPPAPSPITQ